MYQRDVGRRVIAGIAAIFPDLLRLFPADPVAHPHQVFYLNQVPTSEASALHQSQRKATARRRRRHVECRSGGGLSRHCRYQP